MGGDENGGGFFVLGLIIELPVLGVFDLVGTRRALVSRPILDIGFKARYGRGGGSGSSGSGGGGDRGPVCFLVKIGPGEKGNGEEEG